MNFEPIRSSRRRKEKEKKKSYTISRMLDLRKEENVLSRKYCFFVSSGNREELKNTKKKVIWGLWEEIDGDLFHVCYL